MNNAKSFFAAAVLTICTHSGYADIGSYNQVRVIEYLSKSYRVFHYHDYTAAKHATIKSILFQGGDGIFIDSANSFSFLIVTDRRTGKTLFKRPCPAITNIQVSKDEKHIICLSSIKFRNPYQIVIFNLSGEVVLKRKISSIKFNLSDGELREFAKTYPKNFIELVVLRQLWKEGDKFHINPLRSQIVKDSTYRDYLLGFMNFDHPELPSLSESTTNNVTWFDKQNPDVRIYERDGRIAWLKFKDNGGVDRVIQNDVQCWDIGYFITNDYITQKLVMQFDTSSMKINRPSPPEDDYPSMQLGNLPYYYTTLEGFLSEDTLRVVPSSKDVRMRIKSFELSIKQNGKIWVSHKIPGSAIPNEIKKILRGMKDLRTVYFDNIVVDMQKKGGAPRTVNYGSLQYIILQ